MAGKPWYNNGKIEIQIGANEKIPDGFVRGRKPLTQEERQSRTNKMLASFKNKSKEELDSINRKRATTWLNNYNKKSEEEKQQIINTRVQTMNNRSDEWKKTYKDNLSKSSKGKNKGKIPWNKGLTKDTDDRVRKSANALKSYMKRHVSDIKNSDPDYFKKWRENVHLKMKENNSFIHSNDEENVYDDLVSIFGENSVVRQYSDERYPFSCDFYIPSEDLFIEVNKHWTHGGHPFDSSNKEDINKLSVMQELAKTSNFYKQAIYVWTDLDVRKQQTAKVNNLNYQVIY